MLCVLEALMWCSLAESGHQAPIMFDDAEDEGEGEAEQIYGSIQKVIDEGGQEVYAGVSVSLL